MKDNQMDADPNIRFEDWEAEQMQDPGFRAEVEKLAVEQWRALTSEHRGLWGSNNGCARELARADLSLVWALYYALIKDNQMDRDLTDLTHDEVMEQWEVLRQSIVSYYWGTLTEVSVLFIRQVVDAIHRFMTQLQRVQLLADLRQHWWMPDWFACLLIAKWPERWLPELRFEQEGEIAR